MNGNSTLSTTLTYLTYAIILAATIAGIKFNVIDNNAGSLIIGATLSHLGIVSVSPTNGGKHDPPTNG